MLTLDTRALLQYILVGVALVLILVGLVYEPVRSYVAEVSKILLAAAGFAIK